MKNLPLLLPKETEAVAATVQPADLLVVEAVTAQELEN
jgi:hypothetical protein